MAATLNRMAMGCFKSSQIYRGNFRCYRGLNERHAPYYKVVLSS